MEGWRWPSGSPLSRWPSIRSESESALRWTSELILVIIGFDVLGMRMVFQFKSSEELLGGNLLFSCSDKSIDCCR